MKQLFLALTVLALITAGCDVVLAQGRFTSTAYGTATTTFAKKGFASRVNGVNFSNDAASGTDTLWCVLGKDTSAARRFPLLKGERILFPASADTVYLKSSANTIPYRVWGVF